FVPRRPATHRLSKPEHIFGHRLRRRLETSAATGALAGVSFVEHGSAAVSAHCCRRTTRMDAGRTIHSVDMQPRSDDPVIWRGKLGVPTAWPPRCTRLHR